MIIIPSYFQQPNNIDHSCANFNQVGLA
uniref:Uncharacterized protein n=1 Tax=Arundo donax TaxID=35708 RepID=A0A0A9AR38_ARUDO